MSLRKPPSSESTTPTLPSTPAARLDRVLKVGALASDSKADARARVSPVVKAVRSCDHYDSALADFENLSIGVPPGNPGTSGPPQGLRVDPDSISPITMPNFADVVSRAKSAKTRQKLAQRQLEHWKVKLDKQLKQETKLTDQAKTAEDIQAAIDLSNANRLIVEHLNKLNNEVKEATKELETEKKKLLAAAGMEALGWTKWRAQLQKALNTDKRAADILLTFQNTEDDS